jgi:enediyne biosynthesis protein E4
LAAAGFLALVLNLASVNADAQTSMGPFRFRDVGHESGFLPAAAGIQGHGAGWGDVDGDGWADLYVGTFHYKDTQPNLFFRNRKGRLELDDQPQLRISTRATGVLFADLDNDGDLDLYVASMPAPAGGRLAERMGHPFAGCSLFRNDGAGRFKNISEGNAACPTDFGGRSVTVLDIDGDGLLDLLVGEDPIAGYNGSKTKTSRLFRNLDGLRFEDVSREIGIPQDAAGLGVAAADVNGDGWPDFFLASTIGNYLMLNDGTGRFHEAAGARETFAWPTAKGDDMVCGVAISDVNGDALPDIVLGQHYSTPWLKPLANRLYLNRGVSNGVPGFEDVTESAGLTPLPLKGPHVEIQDFDNDGRSDIYTSIVKFAEGRPYPVIFRNTGNADRGNTPRFSEHALGVNDFPNDEDRAIKRSGTFFEKMVVDRKVVYSAPGPTCDFDRDGRLDLLLPNWWVELPSLLLKNETKGGHWLDVRVSGAKGVNAMGVGSRVDVYEAGQSENPDARIGSREIATGFGYASSQEAVAHFGLADHTLCDVVVTLPHGRGRLVRKSVQADQRITMTP